jgi:3-hydroxyisobutyrate dehydrogenase-like beta-hydroxyacid dehydrogenase
MPTSTAIIGLGRMGTAVATRLLERGVDVAVWNRTADRCEPLVRLGATRARTPAAAAEGCAIAITMVRDAVALRAVTAGPDGVLAGLRRGGVLMEMSTVGPDVVRRLAGEMPAGAGLVDAPVLGSVAEATEGRLRILAGGADDVLATCAPVLEALGELVHVGPLGSGAAAKLVANAALLGTVALLGETLALAGDLGLDRDTAFRVLGLTPLAAQAERRAGVVASREHPPRFALSLAAKDAALIAAAGADLPLLAATARWLAEAETAGAGRDDYTAVLTHILDTAREAGWGG